MSIFGKKKSASAENGRDALALDTIEKIDLIGKALRKKSEIAQYEREGWERSKANLDHIIKLRVTGEEADALMNVAERNIDAYDQRVKALDLQIQNLRSLRERTVKAKNTLDLFETTKYLTAKSGSDMPSIANPDNEIAEIRRSVFNLEGYKEIVK